MSFEEQNNVQDKYLNIFSPQMEANRVYYPSNLFCNSRSFENWEYSRTFPIFSWGILGHVTCFDQLRVSENIRWIINIYNPPINVRVIYWLLCVTWFKSPNSYHAITPARVDICPLIVSVEEKHSQRNNFTFSSLLFNMDKNQTRVTESSDIVTLKS